MEKQKEISMIDNTLKLLQRGKYELTGEEALVYYTCFSYLVKKLNELKAPEIKISEPQPIKKGKKNG